MFPGRDIQQEGLPASHALAGLLLVYNHYSFLLGCFLVVLPAILLYLLRGQRASTGGVSAQGCLQPLVWLEEGLPSQKIAVPYEPDSEPPEDSTGKAIFASGFSSSFSLSFVFPFPFVP